MKRLPVKSAPKPVRKSAAAPVVPADAPRQPGGWLSFSYSHREISSSGGQTHVRSRDVRYENGKLESESFEGTLGPGAYMQAVEQAQKLVAAQASAVLGFFAAFLPRGTKDK
jgi:hypothetical protein